MDIKDIKNFIKLNSKEFSIILDSTVSEIANAPELKILHGTRLFDFWNNRPNKRFVYAIYFNENLIDNLHFESISSNLSGPITESLKRYNSIQVDAGFNILKEEYIEGIGKNYFENLTQSGIVACFFGEEGIDLIIRGKFISNVNYFYNEIDRQKFSKMYHISNIDDCLKAYAIHAAEPGNNEAFFASRATVKRIQPINPPNNILINKPENVLRNNLLSFLKRNTQHSFSKENELDSKRELDLYTEVEGKKYLIEVKWLGQSVNDDETGFSSKVTDVEARKGVTQTLEYIQELIEKMSYNLHCGFLCVFDAREIKKPINYQDFQFISAELKPYYNNHFRKLDEVLISRNS